MLWWAGRDESKDVDVTSDAMSDGGSSDERRGVRDAAWRMTRPARLTVASRLRESRRGTRCRSRRLRRGARRPAGIAPRAA
jgi:hypothetical protein